MKPCRCGGLAAEPGGGSSRLHAAVEVRSEHYANLGYTPTAQFRPEANPVRLGSRSTS